MTRECISNNPAVPFKVCPKCGFVWSDKDAFAKDPGLEVVGYQAHFRDLTAGFFLFTHACHTTLAVPAGEFTFLYDGPIYTIHATGTAECPGYCLNKSELRPCPAACECAYVREILQILRKMPGRSCP
jgi:hypothetical protein